MLLGDGWFWWWLTFVALFFLLPLAYGWFYRGWGPWWRSRRKDSAPPIPGVVTSGKGEAWGCIGLALWLVLFVALLWLLAGWGWGVGWDWRAGP